MHEGDGFSVKTLEKPYFIVKMTASAMDWPASSDFWEAPKAYSFFKNGRLLMLSNFYLAKLDPTL